MKTPMKTHTTNYFSTLLEVAEDCKCTAGTPPPHNMENPTIAALQFQQLAGNEPYEITSDDLIFEIWAARNNISAGERGAAREDFFRKGQPCMRTSPLAKSWGWGIHFDGDGKMALLGRETEAYRRLVENESVQKVKAMRRTKG